MTAQALKNIYFLYIAVTAIAGGVIGGSAVLGVISAAFTLKLFLVFFSVTFIIGLPFVCLWWSKVDEAVREAHKWAWFWGGSVGMMLGIFFATVNSLLDGRPVEAFLAANGLQAYAFETGLIGMVGLTAYGYMAAWGLWWWKHR